MDLNAYNFYDLNITSQNKIFNGLTTVVAERIKSIPVIGDIIVFTDAIKDINEWENVNKAVAQLQNKIDDLISQNKLDKEYIEENKREIYFLYKIFLGSTFNQPDEYFLEYLSSFLANCLSTDFTKNKMKIVMYNKFSKYTRQHIEVLNFFCKELIHHANNKGDKYTCKVQLEEIKNIDADIVDYCIISLMNDGFITQEISFWKPQYIAPYKISVHGMTALKMIGEIK